MRFYFGKVGWGWRMYGFGWGARWFFGFSIALLNLDRKRPADSPDDTIAHRCIEN
ncbi:MAG: hypothetical protein NUV80_00235 [Candidatus Berkelbacteria bacterium]|nr:hypothetical protein [Candidatus Berkelbacteria bacterium]